MLLGMVNFRECFSPSCLLQMILKEPQRSINSDKQSPRMMTNFQNTKILEMQVFSVRPLKPGPWEKIIQSPHFLKTKDLFSSFLANFKFMTVIGLFAKKT